MIHDFSCVFSSFVFQISKTLNNNIQQGLITAGVADQLWEASQLRERAEQISKSEYPDCKVEAFRLKGIADQIAASIPNYRQAADAAQADALFRAQQAIQTSE